MRARKQSSTSYPIPIFMADATDHITGKTGLSPTVTLSKNNAAFAAAAGAVTEIANGWYSLAGNATDRNTLGPLLVHATGTGADPYDLEYAVVAFDPFDVNLGLTNLDASVNAVKTKTDSLTFSVAGLIDANVKRVLDGAIDGDGSDGNPWGPV